MILNSARLVWGGSTDLYQTAPLLFAVPFSSVIFFFRLENYSVLSYDDDNNIHCSNFSEFYGIYFVIIF